MAQETSAAPAKASWTKIFTAFKIALDMKKLVLAAAGIFCAFAGWWVLSVAFHYTRSFPVYNIDFKEKKDSSVLKAEWDYKKAQRASWNLLHELAGPPDDTTPVDALDIANSRDEYIVLTKWVDEFKRSKEPIFVREKDKAFILEFKALELKPVTLIPENEVAKAELPKLVNKNLTLLSLTIQDKVNRVIKIDGVLVKLDGPMDNLTEHRDKARSLEQIEEQARRDKLEDVYALFKANLIDPRPKVRGLMRIDPWHENRGGNPYLILGEAIKTRGESVVGDGRFIATFVRDDAPVILEPLVKFFLPVVYLFDARAGGFDRLYLILVILWTLLVWGFFGGAICRIAAVQIARNERITLRDAILFTKDRCWSFVAAPVFPLVLVAMLTILLMIFGWIEWIPWFGDVFAGVFWPIVILIGFVMAIVLVGLVGWPLMIATISTEGTDSFDALSRSYSYVYQAPWQYIWYGLVSIVYGAVLVFFIGFMASAMIFLGKWGVSSAIGLSSADPKTDREPSYLFYYAPTSFGWRDLLISSNARFVEERTKIEYDGRPVRRLEFREQYRQEITPMNTLGAILVSIWVYPFFLLVIGFGYSFFWTASTMIYFLMRQHVDDTEIDEVHMEEEDMEDPFLKPALPPEPAPGGGAPSKPGTVSLNVVEPPPSSTAYTTHEPPPATPGAPANPPPNPPSP